MMTTDQLKRFESKVTFAPNGCIIWTGAKAKGYGRFSLNGKVQGAHRVAWEHKNGAIPEGLDLDHQCHNEDTTCLGGFDCPHRACVNPDHLEPVTRQTNLKRHFRRITHCPQGHEYDDENTRIYKGTKICRTCHNQRTIETKKVRRTHCPKGHEYDDENTIITKHGRRMCRKCSVDKAELMRTAKATSPDLIRRKTP
jgi:CxxC motif-containing protein